jgi:hypothetical protein
MTEVATSGNEVPDATMVNPITHSLTPSCRALVTDDSTNQPAPSTSNTSPPRMKPMFTSLLLAGLY